MELLKNKFKNEFKVFMNNADYEKVTEDEEDIVFEHKTEYEDTFYIQLSKQFRVIKFYVVDCEGHRRESFMTVFELRELMDLLKAIEF